jgi:hypothetical protein
VKRAENVTSVCLFEQSQVLLGGERLFEQRFRIQFAAGSGKKMPTIDVDGARHPPQWDVSITAGAK